MKPTIKPLTVTIVDVDIQILGTMLKHMFQRNEHFEIIG
jgi:hypothetical protein